MWFQYTINVSGHLGIDFSEKIRSSAEYSESLSSYDLMMVVYTGYKTCAYCVDYTGLKPREFLRAHVNCVYKKEYIQTYHCHTFLQGSYMFSDLLPYISARIIYVFRSIAIHFCKDHICFLIYCHPFILTWRHGLFSF